MSSYVKYVLVTVGLVFCFSVFGFAPAYAQKIYKIGIANFGKHPSLDSAIEGFKARLEEEGYVEGKNVEYDLLLAQFEMPIAVTVAQTFKEKKKDLILSITTPQTQAVMKHITTVPVIFSNVTDPVGAGIIKSMQRSGNNAVGATDKPEMKVQFDFFKKVVPNLRRLGFPYNPAEANDSYQFNESKKLLKDMGIELVPVAVSNSSEVQMGMQNLVGRVEGVYIPASNVVIVSLGAVVKVCNENKLPVMGSDVQNVKDGACGAVGVNAHAVGRNAGALAVKVLKGAKPSDLSSVNPTSFETHLNLKAARMQGVNFSEDIIKAATVVYK